MSLLTIVETVLGETGLAPIPAAVASSTDPYLQRCFYLANRALTELRKKPEAADYWPQLRQQFLFNLLGIGPFSGTFTYNSPTITGVTGTNLAGVLAGWQISSQYALNDTQVVSVNTGAQTVTMNQNANVTAAQGALTDTQVAFGQEAYSVPTDLSHFIPQTEWDRNFRWQLLGPVNAQEWQVLKSGISPVGPRLRIRFMNNQIWINPCPYIPSGASSPISDLIVIEYMSKNCVAVAAAPTVGVSSLFVNDTDVALISEDLVIKSLKWRLLRSDRMPYMDELSEFEDDLASEVARLLVPRQLPLNAQSSGIRLLNSQQVPDTGFGSGA